MLRFTHRKRHQVTSDKKTAVSLGMRPDGCIGKTKRKIKKTESRIGKRVWRGCTKQKDEIFSLDHVDAVQETNEDQRNGATKRRRPVLSEKEKWSDAYTRVDASNPWKAPASLYKLIQEEHSCDPWRVLIICILLNQTNGEQVESVVIDFFNLCPNAEAATRVKTCAIEKVITSLGLQYRRTNLIKKFSIAYVRDDWTHVTELPGINKYAADAYAIICAGKAEQVIPDDHMLVHYWKFIRGEEDT